MKFLGSALSVLMACLIVGQTDAQEPYSVFFLMRDIENMSEGDVVQLAYFENREDIEFIDLWDNNRIRDPDAWLGLDPLQWADALDLVWIDESVSSGTCRSWRDEEHVRRARPVTHRHSAGTAS